MSVKRRDNKNRILRNGESQRPDGRYAHVYVDSNGKQKFLYSWKLESTDKLPQGKRECVALRDKIKALQKDLDDGIISNGGGMTVLQLVEKYTAQKKGVRLATKSLYNYVIQILRNEPIGAKYIDKVKLSDAKDWFVKLQADGKSYGTIRSIRGVVRPAFKMAVDDDLIRKNPFDDEYSGSLKFLSKVLYQATGKKTVILIDEYDVPLENAYFKGFYEEMVDFIRSLFESSLKTNDYLQSAVITGCLRISKESIFTGLNHLKIISVLDKKYSEHFGFTESEVWQMMAYYGAESRFPIMKEWYDGYLFGNTEVYNPWSVINFMYDLYSDINAFPHPYWINTSSNDIIKEMIVEADRETKGHWKNLVISPHMYTILHGIFREISWEHGIPVNCGIALARLTGVGGLGKTGIMSLVRKFWIIGSIL